jgi:hypothetical protein
MKCVWNVLKPEGVFIGWWETKFEFFGYFSDFLEL